MNRATLAFAAAAFALAAPVAAHNGVIHEAPHGGIMSPIKNAHIEIVLAPAGGVRIYIYDLNSVQLPASAASVLSVEIARPGAKTEYVTMAPDKTGTLWTGASKPVTDPKSIIRVGSVVQGQSGLIELTRSKFPVYAKPAAKPAHAH
jgi:hypothetical protein